MSKPVLIIGAALSGGAVAKLLLSKGKKVIITDINEIAEKCELEMLGAEVFDNGHPDSLLELEYDYVVKNPGIPYTSNFVKHFVNKDIPIYNEIEVALWYATNYRIAAITGTNGKTTTTTLLGEFLRSVDEKNVSAGNIGKPLCELVSQNITDIDVSLEIAAFQLLGTEKFSPFVSTIINLTPDHLDYFDDLDSYYKAKALVYQNQGPNSYFLKNMDDEMVVKYTSDVKCKVVTFSLERTDVDVYRCDNNIYYQSTLLFDIEDLKIVGEHNIQNAMIAATMAYLMGVPVTKIQEVIKNFTGVEHRIEFVASINGVKYYNDSKGTNVDATITALRSFKVPIHLLAGGYDKKLGFGDLKPHLSNVKQLYVYGAVKEQLKELQPNCLVFDTLKEALGAAIASALPDEVVLLSPACASWDQYPNYEVRGNEFKRLVREYALRND